MPHDDDHHRGLAHDLATMQRQAERRQVLRWMAGSALLPLFACATSTGSSSSSSGSSSSSSGAAGTGSCTSTPRETAGPYPGDGSNGPNALTLEGIQRSDMRTSLGGLSGTAAGVTFTLTLTVVDATDGCTPMAGYAVYLWHCDQDGKYSMYDLEDQNYLRAVQETDDNGQVTFTTIFPGCYSGRSPHMHFEVYPSVASISSSKNAVLTSQIAFPEGPCNAVYATAGYETSVGNYARTSFESDNVFSDGVDSQLATVSGTVANGYTGSLQIGIEP